MNNSNPPNGSIQVEALQRAGAGANRQEANGEPWAEEREPPEGDTRD